MFFVTPKGYRNNGLKLKLGKNYHSNNSIWLAVRNMTEFYRINCLRISPVNIPSPNLRNAQVDSFVLANNFWAI